MRGACFDMHNAPFFMQNTPDLYVLSSGRAGELWVERMHQRKTGPRRFLVASRLRALSFSAAFCRARPCI
jgi:hypothetical protein